MGGEPVRVDKVWGEPVMVEKVCVCGGGGGGYL